MELRWDMASLQIENQSNTPCMLHWHSKVDTHPWSDFPLGQLLSQLHLIVIYGKLLIWCNFSKCLSCLSLKLPSFSCSVFCCSPKAKAFLLSIFTCTTRSTAFDFCSSGNWKLCFFVFCTTYTEHTLQVTIPVLKVKFESVRLFKGGWRFPFVGFMSLMVFDFEFSLVMLTTGLEKCWNTLTRIYDI